MSSEPAKLILISAPSGAGKTTVVRHLLAQFPCLSFSVSATTRAPRKGEQHGRDYYFLSRQAFQQKIAAQAFIEWEMVYTNLYYGTLRSELDCIWGDKKVPLLEIDVNGAAKLIEVFGDRVRACAMFICPASSEQLRSRLLKRGTESNEVIQLRIRRAEEYEMQASSLSVFSHVITNDNWNDCVAQVNAVVSDYLSS